VAALEFRAMTFDPNPQADGYGVWHVPIVSGQVPA
jgi:hypothetical protein